MQLPLQLPLQPPLRLLQSAGLPCLHQAALCLKLALCLQLALLVMLRLLPAALQPLVQLLQAVQLQLALCGAGPQAMPLL